MSEVAITYHANMLPEEPTTDLDGTPNPVCLGTHRVQWPDGFTCLVPHFGVPGTVGATPLDAAIPDEREVIRGQAEKIRANWLEAEA